MFFSLCSFLFLFLFFSLVFVRFANVSLPISMFPMANQRKKTLLRLKRNVFVVFLSLWRKNERRILGRLIKFCDLRIHLILLERYKEKVINFLAIKSRISSCKNRMLFWKCRCRIRFRTAFVLNWSNTGHGLQNVLYKDSKVGVKKNLYFDWIVFLNFIWPDLSWCKNIFRQKMKIKI